MPKLRLAIAILVSALLLLAGDAVYAQCAMCRGALECSLEGRQLARGFNRAILSLWSAPFVLVGTFGLLTYRIRSRKREEARVDHVATCDDIEQLCQITRTGDHRHG
jgi:hypothetical protein